MKFELDIDDQFLPPRKRRLSKNFRWAQLFGITDETPKNYVNTAGVLRQDGEPSQNCGKVYDSGNGCRTIGTWRLIEDSEDTTLLIVAEEATSDKVKGLLSFMSQRPVTHTVLVSRSASV